MEIIDLPADKRLNYAYWDIPFKSTEKKQTTYLPAYVIGEHTRINGRNLCLDKLEEIKRSLQSNNSKFANKYENTLHFIKANKRKISAG